MTNHLKNEEDLFRSVRHDFETDEPRVNRSSDARQSAQRLGLMSLRRGKLQGSIHTLKHAHVKSTTNLQRSSTSSSENKFKHRHSIEDMMIDTSNPAVQQYRDPITAQLKQEIQKQMQDAMMQLFEKEIVERQQLLKQYSVRIGEESQQETSAVQVESDKDQSRINISRPSQLPSSDSKISSGDHPMGPSLSPDDPQLLASSIFTTDRFFFQSPDTQNQPGQLYEQVAGKQAPPVPKRKDQQNGQLEFAVKLEQFPEIALPVNKTHSRLNNDMFCFVSHHMTDLLMDITQSIFEYEELIKKLK